MICKFGSLTVLALFAMFLPGAGAPHDHLVTFPGQTNSVTSPDGRYTLRDVDNMAPSPSWSHRIWLDDHRTGKKTLILQYGRSADVAWAPSGTLFFVNDHCESDASDCRIGDAAKARLTLDVGAKLERAFPEILKLELNPAYLDCTRWFAPDTVEMRYHGWGGSHPNGFEGLFELRQGYGFRKLLRGKQQGNGAGSAVTSKIWRPIPGYQPPELGPCD